MSENASITKSDTVETFMKNNTDFQISEDTLQEFQVQLDVFATALTKKAEKQAKTSKRMTITPADVKIAMKAIVDPYALSTTEIMIAIYIFLSFMYFLSGLFTHH